MTTGSTIGLAGLFFFFVAAALDPRGVAAQTTIPPATPDFAVDAAQSHHYEILASRVALAQSQNPDYGNSPNA